MKIKKVTLAYFSGTGCTQMVANIFESQLNNLGLQVNTINIAANDNYTDTTTDLLIILSPVYAFRLASIVEEWTHKLPKAKRTYAAIISVSGGGEVSPNTACRVKCKQLLRQKSYKLIYEKMIVMPSNFGIQATRQMNLDLIHILPRKIAKIIDDIMQGKRNILKPKLVDRFFAVMGKAEQLGARIFGASIRTSDACNQCGVCIKNCPKHNIKMKNGKIKFGFGCIFCMKCIYACPRKALKPRILGSLLLKDGFDMKQLIKAANQESMDQKHSYSNNISWQGVVDYLNDDK